MVDTLKVFSKKHGVFFEVMIFLKILDKEESK